MKLLLLLSGLLLVERSLCQDDTESSGRRVIIYTGRQVPGNQQPERPNIPSNGGQSHGNDQRNNETQDDSNGGNGQNNWNDRNYDERHDQENGGNNDGYNDIDEERPEEYWIWRQRWIEDNNLPMCPRPRQCAPVPQCPVCDACPRCPSATYKSDAQILREMSTYMRQCEDLPCYDSVQRRWRRTEFGSYSDWKKCFQAKKDLRYFSAGVCPDQYERTTTPPYGTYPRHTWTTRYPPYATTSPRTWYPRPWTTLIPARTNPPRHYGPYDILRRIRRPSRRASD